jgi:pimeloyl-ACP methyl ester carboxylesterase
MPERQKVRDIVVVLPGILGSTLSKNGKLAWAPSGGAVLDAIKTMGRNIKALTLPNGIGDNNPGDGVEPVALMPDIHILPGLWTANLGYEKLLDWLRTELHRTSPDPRNPNDPKHIPNLLPVPYDWRLSNRYNGRRLKGIVEPALERLRAQGGEFADAKVIFVCHSMGGLVARWYIEKEGGAEITRKLVTLGTPYRGALNALDYLVNGIRKGIGPIKFDLTDFARSLPSIHQLLPEYACIESAGDLVKTTQVTLPNCDSAMVADGMRFHDELDAVASAGGSAGYGLHPIVGFRQRTATTARIAGGKAVIVDTIRGVDESGDATVPTIAATPKGMPLDATSIHYIADQHGGLQSNRAALDQIEGVLTARPVVYKAAAGVQLGVHAEPISLAGEVVSVEAEVSGGERIALLASVVNEAGDEVASQRMQEADGLQSTEIRGLPPGAYRITVGGIGATATWVDAITCTVLVWGGEGA